MMPACEALYSLHTISKSYSKRESWCLAIETVQRTEFELAMASLKVWVNRRTDRSFEAVTKQDEKYN